MSCLWVISHMMNMCPNLISLFHRILFYVVGDVCFYSTIPPPRPTLRCCFLTFPIQAVISCILRVILNRHLPSLVPVPATHTLRLGAFEQSARSAVLESGKRDISSTLERAFLCSGATFCVNSLPPKKVF